MSTNFNLFLPSLLDRLTDRYPKAKREGVNHTLINTRQHKEAILRDLSFLFNSFSHIKDYELEDVELAKNSVLAYGITSFGGEFNSTQKAEEIEENIKSAIIKFEPRIDKDSLEVELVKGGGTNKDDSTIELMIRSRLVPLEMNESFYVRTVIDAKSGRCSLRSL